MAQRVVSSQGCDLGLLEKSGSFMLLLGFHFTLLEVEILVLKKEEGARRTERRISSGAFLAHSIFYVESCVFLF